MKHNKMTPIALSVGLLFCCAAHAADSVEPVEKSDALKQVTVKGRRNAPMPVERANTESIQQQMVRDNRDLVRYSPDVGVADQGRHQKGFAVRGVEDNRVGISIDGVSLPDSEENSLYKRYGNLNTSRQSIDPELARTIEIVKGADSFNQGSGNLGGGLITAHLPPPTSCSPITSWVFCFAAALPAKTANGSIPSVRVIRERKPKRYCCIPTGTAMKWKAGAATPFPKTA